MAFTYDITADIGKVRLLIGDTANIFSNPAQFNDEEIQLFLSLAGSELYLAAALALESWAATETNNMDAEKIGSYQYTRGAVNKKLTLAKQYRTTVEETPYLTWSELDYRTSGSGITAEDD